MKTNSVIRYARFALGLGVLAAMMCALPTDVDPVRWRTAVQVPLANGRFIIGDEMQKYVDQVPDYNDTTGQYQFEDVIRVVNVDSFFLPNSQGMTPMRWKPDTVKGEVVGFALGAASSIEFEYSQSKLEDDSFDVVLGPIRLSLPVPYSTVLNIPTVGALGPDTVGLPLGPKIAYVRFDDTSPTASVTVTNNTAGDLTNVSLGFQGGTAATVASIPASSSAVLQVPVAGLVIGATANLVVSMTAAATGSVTLSLSLNGALGDSVVVHDSLLAGDTLKFMNDYDLTDTADIDYVDFMDGYFSYWMDNRTDLRFEVKAIHDHMWATSYCVVDPRNRKDNLAALGTPSASDSAQYFRGFMMGDRGSISDPDTLTRLHTTPLAAARMFCLWDSTDALPPESRTPPPPPRSETYVRYSVTVLPRNTMVRLSARDQIIFFVRSSFVQGREMRGRMKRDYHRDSDPQDVEVSYPFEDEQINQLKGKFYFDSMMVDANARIKIPGRAFIDSVVLTYVIYDPADTSVAPCTTITPFGRMKNDTVISQSINVTPLVGNWPSVLRARAHAFVPNGTEVMIINDSAGGVTIDTSIMGRMTIVADLQYRIKPYFKYHVTMPATVALGDKEAREPFKVSGLTAAGKLTDKTAQVKMRVENRTNLYLKLRGLVATDTAGSGDRIPRDSLLSTLSSDSLLRISQTYHPQKLPAGYINLFDTGGIVIPNRGGVYENNITLTDAQLNRYIRSKKAAVAWLATFLPKGPDALIDTDYVYINASVLVEGVAGTDSLFTEDWGD